MVLKYIPFYLNVNPVMMARGPHLFPYRTQKLSLLTPMILGGKLPGKVGNRWFFYFNLVAMAKGLHLFPYRTQKLSLFTLMILGGKPPGKVSSR